MKIFAQCLKSALHIKVIICGSSDLFEKLAVYIVQYTNERNYIPITCVFVLADNKAT